MISAGVFLGAPTPCHALASYPGKESPTVGTFDNASKRVADVTAIDRSLPALMYSMDAGSGPFSGVKRTFVSEAPMSANDPKRTSLRNVGGIHTLIIGGRSGREATGIC